MVADDSKTPAVLASSDAAPPSETPVAKAAPPQEEQEDESGDVVDRLNAQTRRMTARRWPEMKPGDEDWGCIDAVKNGAEVFKHRYWLLMYAFWAYTAYGLLTAPSLPFLLSAAVATYFYIDLYGAVLHVVLDNPNFLKLPFLAEPCLEFQWHHLVPHDITTRTFRHIAADINGIVGLEFVWHLLLYKGMTDPRPRAVACCAVAHAYLGQWSHRQAHMVAEKRHPLAVVLQNAGILLPPDTHRRHHKTYDQGFPILSGSSDRLMTFLHKLDFPGQQWMWLALFVAMTFGGITAVASLYMPLYDKAAAFCAATLGPAADEALQALQAHAKTWMAAA